MYHRYSLSTARSMLQRGHNWRRLVIEGVTAIMAGIVLLMTPDSSLTIMLLLLGVVLLTVAMSRLRLVWRSSTESRRSRYEAGLLMFGGAIGVLAGTLVMVAAGSRRLSIEDSRPALGLGMAICAAASLASTIPPALRGRFHLQRALADVLLLFTGSVLFATDSLESTSTVAVRLIGLAVLAAGAVLIAATPSARRPDASTPPTSETRASRHKPAGKGVSA